MNVYLIGMPGCGKSTIGKIISSEINKKFVDLDEYIVSHTGESIADLFKKGEPYFREVEAECLKKISRENDLVVATGGGVIKTQGNKNIMRKTGRVVYIYTPADLIIKNSALDGRPLLAGNKNRIFNLYKKRRFLYRNACHKTVNNIGSIDETVKKILNAIK